MPHGIQGAPGVGFNLTADGNYDMVGRKLTNVGAPTSNSDAATKKYVDDNSGGGKTSLLTVDSNIDMKDSYRILNLKAPSDADEPATKQYADIRFFFRDGSHPLTGDVNMNNNKIKNLPDPDDDKQPVTRGYGNSKYLKVDGTSSMTGNLNMGNKKLTNVKDGTNPSDAVTRKQLDNVGIGNITVAFTSYDKVLVELRSALRGDEFNKQEFIDRMKIMDEIIIDQTPLADRFVKKYKMKNNATK